MFGSDKTREIAGLRAENAMLREEAKHEAQRHREQVLGLERMNTRLQGDLDWAKHRLNQVERERAQLISAAIGVRIAVPEFQPVTEGKPEADALSEMPNLATVGGDAVDDSMVHDHAVMIGDLGKELPVNYENMPGFRPRMAR
jgi:hypothetical protein